MDFWQSGLMVFGLAVVAANIKVLIISHQHSVGSIFINIGSMSLYMLIIRIASSMFKTSTIYNTFPTYNTLSNNVINPLCVPFPRPRLFKQAVYHMGNILAIASTSFFDFAFELWNRKPSLYK